MADMKESALTQQSDCKWVRALDSNGNSIRISKEDLAAVVGELLPEATNENKGLMPSKYPSYFPISSWGTASNSLLIKIGRMEKQSGAIYPLGVLVWEKITGAPTTFFTLSIINRVDGVFRGIKNIGPGKRSCKLYYKEEGNFISLYISFTLCKHFCSICQYGRFGK